MQKRVKIKGNRTLHIKLDIHKCVACWECVDNCPEQVLGRIRFLWHKHIIIKNAENCSGCKKCIETCHKDVFSEI